MAITSLSQISNNLKPPIDFWKKTNASTTSGRWFSTFYSTGIPAAAVIPDAVAVGVAGVALSGYSGQLSFSATTAGLKQYIAALSLNTQFHGEIVICDRLWHNAMTAVTLTSVQTINSVPFAARDITGGTNGAGVMIGAEMNSTMGAGAPTYTMTYVNEHGVAGCTVTTPPVPTTMNFGDFIPIPLASGHTGIQQIQTWQQSVSHTSGRYSLVAYRPIARISTTQYNMNVNMDAISLGLPELYDNSTLFVLWYPGASSITTLLGTITLAEG